MAIKMYLQLDGVKGDCTDKGFLGAIEVFSYSFGQSSAGSSTFAYGGGGPSGKITIQDASFVLRSGNAATKLFTLVATGKHIKNGVFTLVSDSSVIMRVTFQDVLASSWNQNETPSESDRPDVSLSINFEKIAIEYRAATPAAAAAGGKKP